MKLFAVLLGALALVAGFTGGLRAYSVVGRHGPRPAPVAVSTTIRPAQVVRPGAGRALGAVRKPAVRVGAPASPT